jgi:proteasome lid subunit RPN8/RPN11
MRSTAFDEPTWPRRAPSRTMTLLVPPGVVDATVERLRASHGREAIVLWAGRPDGSDAVQVSHLIEPATSAGEGWIKLDVEARLEVIEFLRAENLLVVADIHSHPEHAFLSWIDKSHPYSRRAGHLAIVVPFFASAAGIGDWRAYEFALGEWRERCISEVVVERGE